MEADWKVCACWIVKVSQLALHNRQTTVKFSGQVWLFSVRYITAVLLCAVELLFAVMQWMVAPGADVQAIDYDHTH